MFKVIEVDLSRRVWRVGEESARVDADKANLSIIPATCKLKIFYLIYFVE